MVYSPNIGSLILEMIRYLYSDSSFFFPIILSSLLVLTASKMATHQGELNIVFITISFGGIVCLRDLIYKGKVI